MQRIAAATVEGVNFNKKMQCQLSFPQSLHSLDCLVLFRRASKHNLSDQSSPLNSVGSMPSAFPGSVTVITPSL